MCPFVPTCRRFPKRPQRNKRNREEYTRRKASSFVNHRQTSGWPRPPTRAGQASPSTNLLGGKYSWNKKTSTRRWLADGQLERSLPGNVFESRRERLSRDPFREGATQARKAYRGKNCFEFLELLNEREEYFLEIGTKKKKIHL